MWLAGRVNRLQREGLTYKPQFAVLIPCDFPGMASLTIPCHYALASVHVINRSYQLREGERTHQNRYYESGDGGLRSIQVSNTVAAVPCPQHLTQANIQVTRCHQVSMMGRLRAGVCHRLTIFYQYPRRVECFDVASEEEEDGNKHGTDDQADAILSVPGVFWIVEVGRHSVRRGHHTHGPRGGAHLCGRPMTACMPKERLMSAPANRQHAGQVVDIVWTQVRGSMHL